MPIIANKAKRIMVEHAEMPTQHSFMHYKKNNNEMESSYTIVLICFLSKHQQIKGASKGRMQCITYLQYTFRKGRHTFQIDITFHGSQKKSNKHFSLKKHAM